MSSRCIDASENKDFQGVEISTVIKGTPKKGHIIKLDTAKEMAMLERNEKDKQVRRYFIQVEKKYKEKVMLGNSLEGISPELQAVHKRGVNALGGKDSNAYKDKSIHSKVYQDIYCELKRQFGVTTYKAIRRNQCEQAVAVIDDYGLPIVLQEEVKNCNAQMNMEVA